MYTQGPHQDIVLFVCAREIKYTSSGTRHWLFQLAGCLKIR